jgi:hypothetical protein
MLRFTELVGKSVTRNCGEAVESRGFKIFILPLPVRRGTKYVEQCYTDKVIDRLRSCRSGVALYSMQQNNEL